MTVSEDDFARWRSDPVTQAVMEWLDREIYMVSSDLLAGPAHDEPADIAAVRLGRLNGTLMGLDSVKNVEITDVRHD
jgi:hypothetical protein